MALIYLYLYYNCLWSLKGYQTRTAVMLFLAFEHGNNYGKFILISHRRYVRWFHSSFNSLVLDLKITVVSYNRDTD